MSYTDNPQFVNAGIGHNSGAFDQAVERFETAGFLLAKYETLWKAIKDKRLDRPALLVLAELVQAINRESMTTWLSRETIAANTGLALKTISNNLCTLKALGYIVSERRETPQANNRVLLHYTLAALSPEEIEETITRTVQSLRGQRNSVVSLPARTGTKPESSRQDGKSLPARAGTDVESSRPNGNIVPARTGSHAESSRQDGMESSRQDGNSNLGNSNLVSNPPPPLKGGIPPPELSEPMQPASRQRAGIKGAHIPSGEVFEAFEAYNALAQRIGLPIARAFPKSRQDKVRARLDDIGGVSVWHEALREVEASSFLRGENDRGWVADLDFLLQASSLLKVLDKSFSDATRRKAKRPETFHDRLRKMAASGEGE